MGVSVVELVVKYVLLVRFIFLIGVGVGVIVVVVGVGVVLYWNMIECGLVLLWYGVVVLIRCMGLLLYMCVVIFM